MKISTEFSKNALHYENHNQIQDEVVKHLLSKIDSKPQHILDLGCGSGALCKNIDWEYQHFTGVDFAAGMLELHPKSSKIESIFGDFNDPSLYETLSTYRYDYIFSASALQWAEDLESVLRYLKQLNTPIAFAIFTSNTFKTLHQTAGVSSLLKTPQEIEQLVKKYFNVEFELKQYSLEFDSTREMFRYIKQSGVSGSRGVLNYKETKRLMEEYPLSYLEFEVAFILSKRSKIT